MLQYVCKLNTAKDPNFPTKILELSNLIKTNIGSVDLRTPFKELEGFFDSAKNSYLDLISYE